MNAAATVANTPSSWEAMRFREQMPEAAPTYRHRLATLLTMLSFTLRQAPGPAAILDVGAGTGQLGRVLRQSQANGSFAPCAYHATEQTDALCQVIRQAVPDASVAAWSYVSAQGAIPGSSLIQALGDATDVFAQQYPVIVLSHVLEHVGDPYGLLDELWALLKPGGFLVLAVPREDEHRTHDARWWDWNRLLGVLRQYSGEGMPIACWPGPSWSDLYCAAPRPRDASSTPSEAPAAEGRPIRVAVHADERVQGSFPTALDTEAHTPPRVGGVTLGTER